MSTTTPENTSKNPTSAAPTNEQNRLKTFFDNQPDDAHPTRWDDLWRDGTFLPWDRGSANPALIDLLNHPSTAPTVDLAPTKANGARKRALVPGCGKGYDLALLAARGYDAYGLEISESAVKTAEAWLVDTGSGSEGEYDVVDEKVGKGEQKMLLGDFFKDEWAQHAGGIGEGFDLIYDCTFLSALPPSMRAAWARRMSELLAPEGILICLEFPTHKPPKSGGPPWALPSNVYLELFKRPGEEIQYDGEQKVVETDRQPSERALERVAYWRPERTHKVGIINGDVKDRVSVWAHASK